MGIQASGESGLVSAAYTLGRAPLGTNPQIVEASLGREVERLLAIAENYPELKASAHFVALQREISHAEEQIQFARRYYNGAVRNLNVRIDSFPDLILARLFRYRPAKYFELDRSATS